jgi:hypothetical protein
VNTDELESALMRAELRVLEIQTKLHRWARDDSHRRFDDLFNLAAPRGALSYPRQSREELRGRFLGPMANLDAKARGNNSMSGK